LKSVKNANEFDYSYYYPERFNIFLKTIVVISGFIGARINVLNGKWHIYGLLAASLAAYGALFAVLIYKIKEASRFILSCFAISFILLLIAAHIKFPVPDPKYFYAAFPFFILLLGNLFIILKKRWQVALVFLLVIGFNFTFLYNYYFVKKYERENWKNAVAMVESDYKSSNAKNGIMISPSNDPYPGWRYYSTGVMPAIGAFGRGLGTSTVEGYLGEEISSHGYRVVYLSRFLVNLYDPSEIINSHLETSGFRKTAEIKDTKVEFWRYDRQAVNSKFQIPNSK
jgi:hypothetical protein